MITLGLSLNPGLHFKSLLTRHNIKLEIDPRLECIGMAHTNRYKIILREPVCSLETYAVGLHEMGHIVDRVDVGDDADLLNIMLFGPSERVLKSEMNAWRWAKNNALWWRKPMQDIMVWSLSTYGVTDLADLTDQSYYCSLCWGLLVTV